MDLSKRLEGFREKMKMFFCEAILIEHPTNLFYLTGLDLSLGKLVISKNDSCLIVDGRYVESSQKQTLFPVLNLKEEVIKEWLCDHGIHQLGFDPIQTSYQTYGSLSQMSKELQSKGYELALEPQETFFRQLRMIKDNSEIESLRKAAQLGYKGYEFIVSLLKEGVSEIELAFELEFFWKKRGANKLAFDPIIAFGSNSSMPHYRAGPTKLVTNTSVLIDIGVVLDHYHSDMTRMAFFGKPPAIIEVIYSIVQEAKDNALAACRPGITVGEIDKIARDWISSKGYGEQFSHSLGHGIGLDIHEPPILRATGIYKDLPLQAGMVVTVEPGIYLPNIGGVRLEDTILITENGYENLTRAGRD